MPDIKIKTKGMHCKSCEMLIKEALEEQEGINKVEASYKSGIVSVNFDNRKITEKDIIDLIRLEGYETI